MERHLVSDLSGHGYGHAGMTVPILKSAFAYWCQHSDWEERVSVAAATLASLKPSLLLSNIPYLSLAAARRAEVPSVAFSSLNWADIFNPCCGHLPEAPRIREQMVDA
jgi:hypothetical protein